MSTNEPEDDSSDVECPTCGRTDFKNELGVKRHHAKAHDEPIRKTVVCAWCGDAKDVIPSQAEKSDRHFCNPTCHGEWTSRNQTGENNPSWDGGPATVVCAFCGDEKQVQQSTAGEDKRHFCDQDCYGEWRSVNIVGENHWQYDSTWVSCAWCGDEKQVPLHEVESYDQHFCDLGCKGKWQHAQPPEAQPRYEGGPALYGPGWTERKRERVRDSQNRRCASCGARESELLRKLDVHHIIPARQFDDPLERNDDSNLVALCRFCHRQWEGIPLRPQLVK